MSDKKGAESKLLIIGYIATSLLVCGIVLTSHPQEYLFIEIQKHQNRPTIEGNASLLMINSLAYNLINSTLYMQKGTELNASVIAVYGSEFETSGDTGSSISSRIYPITNLPYNQEGVSITKIDGDNITLNCYGSSIILAKGGSWKNVINRTDTVEDRLINVTTAMDVHNYGPVPVIAW